MIEVLIASGLNSSYAVVLCGWWSIPGLLSMGKEFEVVLGAQALDHEIVLGLTSSN
jgi:hypothetical protein